MSNRFPTIIELGPLTTKHGETVEEAWERMEKPVHQTVERIVTQLKQAQRKKRHVSNDERTGRSSYHSPRATSDQGLPGLQLWSDPDFGPSKEDVFGHFAFYRDGSFNPPLPDPERCIWTRPRYKDTQRRASKAMQRRNRSPASGTISTSGTLTQHSSEQHMMASNSADERSHSITILRESDFFLHSKQRTVLEGSDLGDSYSSVQSLSSDEFWRKQVTGEFCEALDDEEDLHHYFSRAVPRSPPAFCEQGQVFLGGGESNDCVQGNVGNCWFIGALSVLATREDLLRAVLWKSTDQRMLALYQDHGFFVCKFYKNTHWYYVFIDDRLPVFAATLKPVFGHCRECNELWVPLIEKGYAKLHQSYDSLTGGFIDSALRDLTGLNTEQIILDPNIVGFNKSYEIATSGDLLWNTMHKWINQWGCMLGCSIALPQAGSTQPRNQSHEVDIGDSGLLARHAYAIIDVGEILVEDGSEETSVRLVRIRNPWGFGEWNGSWADNSPKFTRHFNDICREFSGPVRNGALKHPSKQVASAQRTRRLSVRNDRFATSAQSRDHSYDDVEKVTKDSKDGTFFMEFSDWLKYFSVLFVAYDFPTEFAKQRVSFPILKGETNGGHILKKSYLQNPQFVLQVKRVASTEKQRSGAEVLISLTQEDERRRAGKAQNKKQVPLGFHLFDQKQFERMLEASDTAFNHKWAHEACYKLHLNVSVSMVLKPGVYVIVPSVYDRNSSLKLLLSVFCSKQSGRVKLRRTRETFEDISRYKKLAGSPRAVTSFPAQDEAMPCLSSVEYGPDRTDGQDHFDKVTDTLFEVCKQRQVDLRLLMSTLKEAVSCSKENGINYKAWCKMLRAAGLTKQDVHRQDFTVLAGNDNVIDCDELEAIFNQEIAFGQLYGDHLTPTEGGATKLVKYNSENMGSGNPEYQSLVANNKVLATEIVRLRQEHAKMMHVLLLYGKMLNCYSGPVYDATKVLAKTSTNLALHDLCVEVAQPGSESGAETAARQRFVLENDQFLAVKPWKGQIVRPKDETLIREHYKSKGYFDRRGRIKKPSETLVLDHIYGHNGHIRNGVQVTKTGDLVYAAAAVGVIWDPEKRKPRQIFNKEHDDDLSCLDYCQAHHLVVTGQVGKNAKVVVWDAGTGETRKVFTSKRPKDQHSTARIAFYVPQGIGHIKFSAQGEHVVAIGLDDAHTICVFRNQVSADSDERSWANGELVAQLKGDRRAFRVITCLPSLFGESIVAGGVDQLVFYSHLNQIRARESYRPKRASFGKIGARKRKLVVTALVGLSLQGVERKYTCAGTGTGSLLVFDSHTCIDEYQDVHEQHKAAHCLVVFPRGTEVFLFSAGADGRVVLLVISSTSGSRGLQVEKVSSIKLSDVFRHVSVTAPAYNVTSLHVARGAKRLVLATSSSEIFQLDISLHKKAIVVKEETSRVLSQGHYKEEVWGLDVGKTSDSGSLFVTCGDDMTLRVYDYHLKKQLCWASVGNRARAVAFDSASRKIVCGLGGRFGGLRASTKRVSPKHKTDQSQSPTRGVKVFHIQGQGAEIRLQEVGCYQKIKSDVACVRYSPDASQIAVGCRDGKVSFFHARSLKRFKTQANKSSSSVTQLDYSADSRYIRTTDGNYELLFYQHQPVDRTSTGSTRTPAFRVKQVTKRSKLQQLPFSTHTCLFSWHTLGIWEAGYDGTDINSVAVHVAEDRKEAGEGLLAIGDDFGQVKLFRYPAYQAASPVVATGHSSHVTNVKFSSDGKWLFSTGGHDRCIFQWKVQDKRSRRHSLQ